MFNRFLNEKYQNKTDSFIAAAADLKESKDNIIDLSLGDPDIITAKSVIKEAARDAEAGYTRYAHPRGDKELRQEIIRYYMCNYDAELTLNEMMVTVGACHGTFLALAAVLNSGEEVIIPSPYFTPYKGQVELAGGKAVFLKTKMEDNFQIDPEKLEELISDKTKVILINSPHNPTGVIQNKMILKQIVELAEKYDLLVFSDEVYEAFDYNNKFYSLINFQQQKERIVILNSFSKIFAMTGWRVGFVIAQPDILDIMQEINEGVCYSAPSISQRAALSALRQEKQIKDEIIITFKERVEYVWKKVKENPYLSAAEPEGAFYLYINIKKSGLSADDFALKLLKNKSVLVLPGRDFGDSEGEFVRVACTLEIKELEKAFDRINKFIQEQIGVE
ncbi:MULTISPECIES: aminotransferase class I/II-fold pyridoxal phosphate-dependent enzyme [unclassified Halanaerobium]|uniref:aminotransferase class I/II-fold pyridoxal phosphate-dependent enzyme n=1 Tax=unclassified Halanaerobium TaxID=2641197 RepID=UPI000E18526D|nr:MULTISPECIES: aminotransferase class I/II-fold pyridoxal phosphate-dependent enzyme [unclassified Halanaerobium]RCW41690.1 aspartate/methionine/tyrosine aminotransferase [Halanaerobium sp. MA284_MarDTE_T2]RCW79475.1 aspartate/methionine/tyrosine aminotransferase [Halanaerobium sp. DL-01]